MKKETELKFSIIVDPAGIYKFAKFKACTVYTLGDMLSVLLKFRSCHKQYFETSPDQEYQKSYKLPKATR